MCYVVVTWSVFGRFGIWSLRHLASWALIVGAELSGAKVTKGRIKVDVIALTIQTMSHNCNAALSVKTVKTTIIRDIYAEHASLIYIVWQQIAVQMLTVGLATH
jgi:hypothetical protein